MVQKSSSRRLFAVMLLVTLSLILLSACAPGDQAATPENPAGFFWGVWHGWIAPISLIIGIFNPAIRVYEKFNTGWWYDFGYYMAIIGGFGGLALARRRRSNRS